MSIDLGDRHVYALSLALASKCGVLRRNEHHPDIVLADYWLSNLQAHLPCPIEMEKESSSQIIELVLK